MEVDRILDARDDGSYLVKWKSLQYDECTWELASDVDPDKVQAFLRVNQLPPEQERKVHSHFPIDTVVCCVPLHYHHFGLNLNSF